MALSTNLIDYVSITTQNGVTDNVNPQPSDNCHTIIMFNTSTTNAAYVGVVPSGTNLDATNSATLPAEGTMTLRVGTMIYRPGGRFGGNMTLRVEGVGGTPTLQFQFVNASREVAP